MPKSQWSERRDDQYQRKQKSQGEKRERPPESVHPHTVVRFRWWQVYAEVHSSTNINHALHSVGDSNRSHRKGSNCTASSRSCFHAECEVDLSDTDKRSESICTINSHTSRKTKFCPRTALCDPATSYRGCPRGLVDCCRLLSDFVNLGKQFLRTPELTETVSHLTELVTTKHCSKLLGALCDNEVSSSTSQPSLKWGTK